MNGYYDVVDGVTVWRYFRDCQPDIVPSEIRTDLGLFTVVLTDQSTHNEETRLPDLVALRDGHSADRMSGSSPPRRALLQG